MKNKKFIIFILIIIILLIIHNLFNKYTRVTGVCGITYKVLNSSIKQKVANKFCELGNETVKLQKYLKKYFPNDPRTKRILNRFHGNSMVENPKETYTLFKGYSINMCMQKNDTELYPNNLLMFVLLHELTHILNAGFNHTKSYWTDNVWLMKCASNCGIYTNVNYQRYPVNYCGIVINKHPSY
jgi:hypothetical protein